MFESSQLVEISGRFPAHVQEIREFLLKENLPVPAPDAIPQLCERLGNDSRFRADVGSLMRAILYQEREGIGYEELLGILVTAAAGSEHDLKSDSREADIRELLRFLLQSRRSTIPAETEPVKVAVEPEPRESVPVGRVQLNSEPVLRTRGLRSTVHSRDLDLRPTGSSVAVAEAESREPDDVVLPPFRTAGLFASQSELESPWWGSYSARTVGILCMLLGLGLGVMIHRVASTATTGVGVRAADLGAMIHRAVSAAETHLGLRATEISSSKPETAGTAAPKQSATENSNALAPEKHGPATPGQPDRKADAGGVGGGKTDSTAGAAETASVAEGDGKAVQPAASDQVPPPPAPTTVGAGSSVPVTVTKQVVTAFPSQSLDPGDPMATAAATSSLVQKASADMTPANVIFSPAPKYPPAASAARVEGEVTVQAVVDTQGKVISTHVVSGPTVLRHAAQEAVQRWRYRPLLYYGKPIAVTTVAIVDFKFAK